MKSSTTYLHFDGNCRAAMAFYSGCFGGELQLMPMPGGDGKPSADPAAKVMHSQITRKGLPVIQASDSAPGGTPKKGDNFSVSIDCEAVEELEQLFAALAQGGSVHMPLGETPWGRFGMLTDRFGIQWMLNFSPAQAH